MKIELTEKVKTFLQRKIKIPLPYLLGRLVEADVV